MAPAGEWWWWRDAFHYCVVLVTDSGNLYWKKSLWLQWILPKKTASLPVSESQTGSSVYWWWLHNIMTASIWLETGGQSMFRWTGGHCGKHVKNTQMDVSVRVCSLFFCSIAPALLKWHTAHKVPLLVSVWTNKEELLLQPPHTCSLPMATRQYFPVWPASVSSSGIVIPVRGRQRQREHECHLKDISHKG